MSRTSQSLFVAAGLLASSVGLLEAQPTAAPADSGIEVAQLLSWATRTPPDWRRGALFAVFGMAGALITVFGFVGGAVPGTAGKAKIEADSERLERMSKRLEELVADPNLNAPAIEAARNTVNELRDDVRADRRNQFLIAGVMYVVIGALLSTLLAQDVLQALVTGAAWTAVLGSLGLKKDFTDRKDAKDDVLERALQRIIDLENALRSSPPPGGGGPTQFSREPLELLERDIRAVQRL